MKPLRIATHQGGDVCGDDEDKKFAISVLLVMLFGTLVLLLVTSMVLFYLLAIQCSGRLLRTLPEQLIQNALLSGLRIS
jgi:RsiW-degrading membrane proteinase PrsW (M82 family)